MSLKNAKAKGSRLERKSRDIYRSTGFLVIKAGGSLGPVDLVALQPESGVVHLVQAKANRWPGPIETACLEQLSRRCKKFESWRVLVHRWDDRKGLTVKVI